MIEVYPVPIKFNMTYLLTRVDISLDTGLCYIDVSPISLHVYTVVLTLENIVDFTMFVATPVQILRAKRALF